MTFTPASTRRTAIRIAAAAAIGAAAAAAALPAAAATAPVKTISMRDDFFVRAANDATITVKKGTIVRFANRGVENHNATVAIGPVKFRSGKILPGGVYRKQVTKTGKYIVVCTIHPGMQVNLRVIK